MAKTVYLHEECVTFGRFSATLKPFPYNVYAFNERSIRLHEKMGFQKEGQIRRAVYTNGQYYDEILYGMTKEEFESICRL